jgi:hypothetical protein
MNDPNAVFEPEAERSQGKIDGSRTAIKPAFGRVPEADFWPAMSGNRGLLTLLSRRTSIL